MSSHCSGSRDSSYVSSAMYPRIFQERKANWVQTTVYTYGKAAKRSSMDQVEWLNLRPCLVPSQCEAGRTIWDCCWSWGRWGPSRAAAPATLPKGKAGTKMSNEWVCRPTFNLSIYSSLFAKSECHIQITQHICTETCVFVKGVKKFEKHCLRSFLG